jgi:hypothetical protein
MLKLESQVKVATITLAREECWQRVPLEPFPLLIRAYVSGQSKDKNAHGSLISSVFASDARERFHLSPYASRLI